MKIVLGPLGPWALGLLGSVSMVSMVSSLEIAALLGTMAAYGCNVSHFNQFFQQVDVAQFCSVRWAATRGGFVIIDDWGSWPHAQLAVIDFLEQNGLATALPCLAKMMSRVNSSDQENSESMDMLLLHYYMTSYLLDYMT